MKISSRQASIALVQMPGWGVECPPYALACLSAYVRQHTRHKARCFDFNIKFFHSSQEMRRLWEDKDLYSLWEDDPTINRLAETNSALMLACADEILAFKPDIVGFSTHTTSFRLSLKLAEIIRKKAPGVLIVFGGPQCSRSQAGLELVKSPWVDATVLAEGEEILAAMLDSVAATGKLPRLPGTAVKTASGRIKDCGAGRPIDDLNSLPYPDYSDFRPAMQAGLYRNPKRMEILDSRGCPTQCNFCSEWQFWDRYRTMSGERIFAEAVHQLGANKGISHFYFIGSLMNGNPRELEKFCDLVIESGLPITWEGQAKVHPLMTAGLISKMARAGCKWIGIGIESGSERLRKTAMHKAFTNANALDMIKSCAQNGIKVQINIMFGHPGETKEDFNETLKFLMQARPYLDTVLASQSFCVLDKHTNLYNDAKKYGIRNREHHLFWNSDGGENTYLERFRRYEEFCRLALFLGLPETSGVLRVKPDKWFMLGEYFAHTGDRKRAVMSYRKSLRAENFKETAMMRISALSENLYTPERRARIVSWCERYFSPKSGKIPETAEGLLKFQEENLRLNEEEFRSGTEIMRSTPRFITLGTHWKCNAKCIFCQDDSLPSFTPDIYYNFLEPKLNAALKGAEKISFVGFGELLFMPGVGEFLTHINATLPHTWKIFTTNGSPLVKQELQDLLCGGLYSIQVSLHAPRPALHKELTGLDNFNDIVTALRRLLARRIIENRNGKLHVSLVCVLNEKNIDFLPEMAAFAAGLGVQELRCEYMTMFRPDHVRLSCFFHKERTNAALASASAIAAQTRDTEIKLPPMFGVKADSPYEPGHRLDMPVCDDPWRHIYVESQGTVLPCCFWGRHAGDIREHTFEQVWNGPEYRRLRSTIAGQRPERDCVNCVRRKGYEVNNLLTHITARPDQRDAVIKFIRDKGLPET